ncbi:MAG: acyl-CoA thioesterase [Proteobacteria bacterium]|nr:acyl-CoA thioesterase [Pseudomonadota bacterium]
MQKIFTAPYAVTIGDINYGGHLGNDRPLLIFQDARIRFLQRLGFSERNIGEGKGIVVVEAGCRYLRQVFLHDELDVHVTIGELEGKKCRLDYSVDRKGDGQKVLTGFTLMLAYDYDSRKAVALPEPFLFNCRQWLSSL